jgi:4-amino-4-deoxy-L-arabinose transferase-like glycosyltransferase
VKTVFIVFVVALLMRLLALAHFLPKLNPDVDLDSYRSLGRSLAGGRGFVAPAPDGRALPNIARTPVYPWFLAGLMRIGGDRLGWFLAVQCVLGAATCSATVVLARRWVPSSCATAAGLLVALDPNSVMRCVDLRTETLFTLLLVGGAGLLLRRDERRWAWLLAGILWSLAALTRPIAAWLWLVMVTAFVVWRPRVSSIVVFLAGYLVLPGVWAARNGQLTGRPFVSTISTYNLLMYRAAGIEAERSGAALDAVQLRWRDEYGDLQWFDGRPDFVRQLKLYRETARRVLRSAPAVAFGQTAVGWGKVLFGPGARSLDNSLRTPAEPGRWRPIVYGAALVVTFAFAVIGAWRMKREALLPVALVCYFVLLSGGPEANSRFRVPITPMLAVLAVAAWRRTE